MTEPAPTSATEAIWNWRDQAPDTPASSRSLYRRRALIQGMVMIVFAAFVLLVFHHGLGARIIAGLGLAVIVLGAVAPQAYQPIHAFGQWLGRTVGQLLVYLLLVPFFYLVFFPVSLVLRIQKRDPLHRDFRDPQWSYWIPRGPKDASENIQRQFLKEDREARTLHRKVGTPPGDRKGASS